MRSPALALSSALLLAAGLSPASAQLSGGLGSANATNQSFQQQNALRGVQQQQNFNANQNRLNGSVGSMNTSVGSSGLGGGGYVAPRRGRIVRPERER